MMHRGKTMGIFGGYAEPTGMLELLSSSPPGLVLLLVCKKSIFYSLTLVKICNVRDTPVMMSKIGINQIRIKTWDSQWSQPISLDNIESSVIDCKQVCSFFVFSFFLSKFAD